jgi:phosphogluconate dehydratase
MHPEVQKVTQAIAQRSRALRTAYLQRLDDDASSSPDRSRLSCGNLAHGFAACNDNDKETITSDLQLKSLGRRPPCVMA